MKMSCLEIKEMSCGYHDGFSLKAVNLSVPRGSFFGIIGRNGSGKSTLFKGIVGEVPMTGGEVVINNIIIPDLSLKKRARLIALVPQLMELGPVTVKEYVLMGRIPYFGNFRFSYTVSDLKIAAKYIDLMGLTSIKNKYVTELSGGELQMTAIASALTQQPSLLLLDEPTSHLDISFQSRIMDTLRKLNEDEGLTILMIIHDLNLASEYCSHLALMDKGSVIRQGLPYEVLTTCNIENAYKTKVIVVNHPITDKPLVFSRTEQGMDEIKNLSLDKSFTE